MNASEIELLEEIQSPEYVREFLRVRVDAACPKGEHWVRRRRVKGGGFCRKSRERSKTGKGKKRSRKGLAVAASLTAAGAVAAGAIGLALSTRRRSESINSQVDRVGDEVKQLKGQAKSSSTEPPTNPVPNASKDNDRINKLNHKLDRKRAQIDRLKTSIGNKVQEVDRATRETDRIRSELTAERDRSTKLQQHSERHVAEKNQLRDERNYYKGERERLLEDNDSVRGDLKTARKNLDTANRDLDRTAKKLAKTQVEVDSLTDTLLVSPVGNPSGKGRKRTPIDPDSLDRSDPATRKRIQDNIKRSKENAKLQQQVLKGGAADPSKRGLLQGKKKE